jgi:uncharacterized membrane protein
LALAARDSSLDDAHLDKTDLAPSVPLSAPRLPRQRDPYPLTEAALGVARFALVGASIGLCIATFAVLPSTRRIPFLESNTLAMPLRNLLGASIGVGAALLGLSAIAYLAARRRAGVPRLRRAGEVILPLGLLFTVPSFFSPMPWSSQPLTFLLGLTATGLLLERLLLRSQRECPPALGDYLREKLALSPAAQRWVPLAIVLAGSLFYAVYFSYFTILNHHRLNTSSFDLGINVNWSYNALHGHPARSTVMFGPMGGHFLGNHAIFAMAFWLPIYALHPGAEVLLIVQATLAGLGATTLYLFAATQVPRWSAVIVAYAYLFFAPLHGPNFYDFHELLPPLPVHFLLYWAIAKRKNWLVALLVPVLWSFREDVAVGLTVLGVFLLITGARPKLGLAMAAASGVWFVIIKFAIMPRYWHGWFEGIYKDLQAPGSRGYGTIVQTMLINPLYLASTLLRQEKLIYVLHFFGPLALLPARRAALLLLAIPGFAFSVLTTGYAPTVSIAFQYTCHSIPYVFASSVLMLRLLGQQAEGHLKRRAALGAVVFGVAAHSYVFGAILQHSTFVGGFSRVEFTMTPSVQARYESLKKLAALIPEDASVTATDAVTPHIAARMNAFSVSHFAAPADYLLLEGAAARSGSSNQNLRQMFREDDYGLVQQDDDLYLFKRGFASKETKAALKALRLAGKR